MRQAYLGAQPSSLSHPSHAVRKRISVVPVFLFLHLQFWHTAVSLTLVTV